MTAARRRRAALAAASAALTLLACEALVRSLPLDMPRELQRSMQWYKFRIGLNEPTCAVHGLRFVKPDASYRYDSPNLHYVYSTGSLTLGACRHGYRRNGAGDEAPVFGIALGDSHTENVAMSDQETWVSRLSGATGRRFLNMGRVGQGTLRSVENARILLPALRPRIVLLQLHSNDALDDYYRVHPRPSERETLLDRCLRRAFLWRSDRRSATLFVLHLIYADIDAKRLPEPRPDAAGYADALRLQRDNIREIARLCRLHKARLAVIAIHPAEYYRNVFRLPELCRELGVPWLIADGSWPGGIPPYALRFESHLAPEGQRLLADSVRRLLEPRGWLS